jgi:hypothetical protein
MKNQRDKNVIEHWLTLYNRLTDDSYRAEDWPDKDSSKKNIDAMCRDSDGQTLALEHTLIEPFAGEKTDRDRFMRTLATLENHPSLVLPGYRIIASQAVGSAPTGVDWSDIPRELLKHLPNVLPTLPEGKSEMAVPIGKCELPLRLEKRRSRVSGPGKFFTARGISGDTGPEPLIRALANKIPKLSASRADKKILLLEQDNVAGTIESQFGQIPEDHEIRKLLRDIDEIWSVKTFALETENVIFTNLLVPSMPWFDPATFCSLNVQTGKFWSEPVEMVG